MSIKDQLYQNQYLSEVLRIIISRADDISILKQLSERKTGKVRLNSILAEKVLREVEYREDQRLTRESNTLGLFHGLKFNTKPQRKMLGKLARKMIRVHPQQDQEMQKQPDTVNSEAHLSQIMGVKYTASVANNESKKKEMLMESHKEQVSKFLRFIEAALKEPEVDVEYVLKLCVQNSRNAFCTEFTNQEMVVREIPATGEGARQMRASFNPQQLTSGVVSSNPATGSAINYNISSVSGAVTGGQNGNRSFLPSVHKGGSVVSPLNDIPLPSGASATGSSSVRNQFQSNFNIMKRYNQTLKPDVMIFKNEKMVRMMLNNNTDVERTIRRYKQSRGLDSSTPSRFSNVAPETSRPTLFPQRNRSTNPSISGGGSSGKQPLTPLKTSAATSSSHRPATSREVKAQSKSMNQQTQETFLNSNRTAARKKRTTTKQIKEGQDMAMNGSASVAAASAAGVGREVEMKTQTRRLLREGRNAKTISNGSKPNNFDFAAVTSFLDSSGVGNKNSVPVRCRRGENYDHLVESSVERPLTSGGVGSKRSPAVSNLNEMRSAGAAEGRMLRQSVNGRSLGKLLHSGSHSVIDPKGSPYAVMDDNEENGEVVIDDEDDDDEEDEEEASQDEDGVSTSSTDSDDINSDVEGDDSGGDEGFDRKTRGNPKLLGSGDSSPNLVTGSAALLVKENDSDQDRLEIPRLMNGRSPKRNRTQLQNLQSLGRSDYVGGKGRNSHSLPLSKASSANNLLEVTSFTNGSAVTPAVASGSVIKVETVDANPPEDEEKPTDMSLMNFDDSEDEQRYLEEVYLTDMKHYYQILAANKGLSERSQELRERLVKSASVIQADMKERILRLRTKRVIRLQSIIRQFLAIAERRRRRLIILRKNYLMYRLKSWLSMLIKKKRIARTSSFRLRQLWSKRRYDARKIIKIQHFIRYYVCTRREVRFNVGIRRHQREKQRNSRQHSKKSILALWKVSSSIVSERIEAQKGTIATVRKCWECLNPDDTRELKAKRYANFLQEFLRENQVQETSMEDDVLASQSFYHSKRDEYLKTAQDAASKPEQRQRNHIEAVGSYIQFIGEKLENYENRLIHKARTTRLAFLLSNPPV